MTDIAAGNFRFAQRSSRGVFGESGFRDTESQGGKIAWVEDWILELLPSAKFHLYAGDKEKDRAVDLILDNESHPLIHGKNGVSPKSETPGHASHYYSMTSLNSSGSISVDGKVHHVNGLVWFDHEWASNQLELGQSGWDWTGLHLSNGQDLMIFQVRDKDGKITFRSGTLRLKNGFVRSLSGQDFVMTPEGVWKSPHTAGHYPASWSISIPYDKLIFSIRPKLQDQELVLAPFPYWEGAVRGEGTMGKKPITAEGYLEMTGYGGRIFGLTQ